MKTPKEIIAPIAKSVIKSELTKEKFVRFTRKGDNEIYTLNYHDSPNIMKEIGRLRELTFRASGGGTGEAVDIDNHDTNDICYQQLIVWSPEDEEIIGGYRYILGCNAVVSDSDIRLSTAHYFNFSKQFIHEYLPITIELGRSWVQPNYQPSVNPRKGLFALDNIFDGLGAITVIHPEIKYLFGKVTMYPSYDRESRDFLLHFLRHYFPDNEKLMVPYYPLLQELEADYAEQQLKDLNFKDGFKVLNAFVRARGENIPPLVNIYMNLSPSMKTFGTAVNPDFGGVEETGIMLSIDDIYDDKKERHIHSMNG